MVACTATAALLAPLIWWWQHSLLPDSFPVTGMGYMDVGGGPAGAMATGHGGHAPSDHGGRSVTSLVADVSRRADVSVTLTARKERVRLASGRSVDGYTLNGHTPGPLIRAAAGQLVQVRLVNASVPDGVTLHWHGLDVPGAEDGVAGVTQDAVAVGREFTYRFVPRQVGTFWYHSHQNSREQVGGGLLGALVITPATTDATAGARSAASGAVRAGPTGDEVDDIDVPALVHIFGGVRTINGLEGSVPVPAAPGRRTRVRVINTENGQMPVWVAGASFRVLAVDGHDLTGAGQLANTTSVGAPAFSTGDPGCGGRSTDTSFPTCRCSS
ncbi:MAG TPA: multicopper oxidase domain-containing protein [Kineosporiaceae bacterium]|nr:multicopper oxidase domain-containing protein [Kineosporiaceae bacterium]